MLTPLAQSLAALVGLTRVGPQNPVIALSYRDVRRDIDRLHAEPAGLTRPLVILNGYRSPPVVATSVADWLARGTSHRRSDILIATYTRAHRIEDAAARALKRVQARWPSSDPAQTVEVDVIGISMGGLVGRWAALPAHLRNHPLRPSTPDPRRLRVARMFTFATPHRGALMASHFAPDDAARDMIAASKFLTLLESKPAAPDYELVCYSQYRDRMVGALNAAPAGHPVLWARSPLILSHFTLPFNPWVYADLCRRLRHEPPIITPGPPPPRS